MFSRVGFLFLALLMSLLLLWLMALSLPARPTLSQALDESEAEQAKISATESRRGRPSRTVQPRADSFPESARLFVGLDNVALDTYLIDVNSNAAYPVFTGAEVWGAAYDPDYDRFLFNDGADLWHWPVGRSPVMLGTITVNGADTSMPGLAYHDGMLYGTSAVSPEGVYSIDLSTYVATTTIPYALPNTADIGGLAIDPLTGQFYGTNDDSDLRGLVQINPDGTLTLLAPYLDGETDVDGLAVGDDGRAYLITDDGDPAYFNVFDFDTMTYTTPISNPYTTAEIFAGGAWRKPLVTSISLTKTVGTDPGLCAPSSTITSTGPVDATYCYRVTNTGDFTVSTHTLVDDQVGTILADFDFMLSPGASVHLTATTQVAETIVNSATWMVPAFDRYVADLNVTYDFMDISATGTALGLTDDGETNVTMPFDLTLFNITSDRLRIGNNGGILFNSTSGELGFGNRILPAAQFDAAILPFWDDIDSDTGGVYFETLGTVPNRMFVVQWHNRPHWLNTGNATFQVILFEGSNEILFQYQDLDFGAPAYDYGASATVGLQAKGSSVLEIAYNTAVLADEMAIRFTPQTISISASGTATVTVESVEIYLPVVVK